MSNMTPKTIYGIDLKAPGGIEALLDFHRLTFGDAVMELKETDSETEGEDTEVDTEVESNEDNDSDLEVENTNEEEEESEVKNFSELTEEDFNKLVDKHVEEKIVKRIARSTAKNKALLEEKEKALEDREKEVNKLQDRVNQLEFSSFKTELSNSTGVPVDFLEDFNVTDRDKLTEIAEKHKDKFKSKNRSFDLKPQDYKEPKDLTMVELYNLKKKEK